MAKTSFAEADNETKPAANGEATSHTSALAARPSSEIVPESFFTNEGVEGDFDKSDMKVPRLNLVQAVGPLSGELGFQPGTFVYNKETNLGAGPVKATVLKMRKYYVEDLPYGSETIPQFFNSIEQARAAGFLDVREKREMGEEHKYVKPVMDVDLMVEGPADNPNFPLEFDGKSYALARWTLQSTAYSRVGKSLFMDSQLALRAGLTTRFYHLTNKREKLGQNYVFVPRAQIAGKNTDEFAAWAKSIL